MMRRAAILGLMLLAGCTLPQPVQRVAPEQVPHEWQHGPPWAPTEPPWVPPPPPPPGYYRGSWDPWWPGVAGPAFGLGIGIRHRFIHRGGSAGRRGRR